MNERARTLEQNIYTSLDVDGGAKERRWSPTSRKVIVNTNGGDHTHSLLLLTERGNVLLSHFGEPTKDAQPHSLTDAFKSGDTSILSPDTKVTHAIYVTTENGGSPTKDTIIEELTQKGTEQVVIETPQAPNKIVAMLQRPQQNGEQSPIKKITVESDESKQYYKLNAALKLRRVYTQRFK